ncbi:MAG: hypothetical protein L6V93_13940 [Clostridiales bacterium]|nr:MAG: hypothetical protein L6V93_13940 [Clostridiales bacterium]
MCNTLNGDFTRHWTGSQHSMTGIITVDGTPKVFMGRMCHNPGKNVFGPQKYRAKSVRVTPLKNCLQLCGRKIELEICFFTPLILDDLDLFEPSRFVRFVHRKTDRRK